MKTQYNRGIIACMLILMLIFTACSSSKEKLNEQIAKTEKEISQQYDTVKMRQLVELYQEYVQEFPKDSLSGEYLFRSGSLNMTLGKGADALRDFTNFINLFPQNNLLPEAYYYKAHIYENIMFDFVVAKTAYYDFLARYPEHKLAMDATFSLQYLGKSTDEIIALFEQTLSDTTEQLQ